MIILYQFEISPFCDKVRRVLHYKGLDYEACEISMQQAVTRVKKVNPSGKLPAIDHDGHHVGDSTDIVHYLEDRFPEPSLVPVTPRERGLCHALEDWADESLYFYEMYLRFLVPQNAAKWIPVLCAHDTDLFRSAGRFLIPRHMKGILVKQGLGRKTRGQVLDDVRRHIMAVDGMLAGRHWLIGGGITLADIAVFVQLHCIRGAVEGERTLAQFPAVLEWMERVDGATQKPDSAATGSLASAAGR